MRNHHAWLLAAVLAGGLTACSDDAPESSIPSIPAAFPEVLLPPEGQLIGRAGGEDALQLIFTSAVPAEPMVAYYRDRLVREPWRLVSDTRDDDAVVLYAEQLGRPMWVRIIPGEGGEGSRIEMSGAVVAVDSTALPAGTDAARDTLGRADSVPSGTAADPAVRERPARP